MRDLSEKGSSPTVLGVFGPRRPMRLACYPSKSPSFDFPRKLMRTRRWTLGKERMREIARVIVGIVLLILVIGTWACLWVPPPL